ncbi:hypothetical protein [Priestia endophytica]|uniref:Uncharacterized protein n=1 Tax=Priestia endophytica TaxID=135735 RepID=A0AAX1Q578_9BACI|nr:hypothetical protein [Priestia endophytica]RAS73545.1 hypothetical protein A3864_20690 [Priestia endophytica]
MLIMNKEISRLQPLNMVKGWQVIENRLLEDEEENKKAEGTFLTLEKKQTGRKMQVRREENYFQFDFTIPEEKQILKRIQLHTQQEVVSEIERAMWNLDNRTDRKEPYDLAPLRVASGWKIEYNTCINIDPEKLPEEDSQWLNFTEDLLLLAYDDGRILIDVGWKREADPSGRFQLIFVIDER